MRHSQSYQTTYLTNYKIQHKHTTCTDTPCHNSDNYNERKIKDLCMKPL